MLSTLINKELRAILLSPKFTATFAVCSVLLLLSVYTGVREYKSAVRQYESAVQLNETQLQESTSWAHVTGRALRKPDPLQIFVSGLSYDIGRWSNIIRNESIQLRHSVYTDDPIFALFRFIDFGFIVLFVLSLFAVLFTYDAVNGERERGTLKLVLSNAVPRARFLVAKCAGAWLGLVAPISVPVLLSLLIVIVSGVTLTGSEWARLLTLLALSLLFFTFFIVFGVMISTLTKRSAVSFLIALVIWVGFVMIIPRAGVMAAGYLVDVPREAEVDAQRDAYAKDQWAVFYDNAEERWQQANAITEEMSEEEYDELMWQRMKEEDSARMVVERGITEYDRQLREDLRQRKLAQERLALTLSRFSPASAYQLAAMTVAGTDMSLKTRYEDAMAVHQEQFATFTEAKKLESGTTGAIMITASEDGFSISGDRDNAGLDISGLPRFEPPQLTYAEALAPSIVDFGLLAVSVILSFIIAFVAFLRYDVR